MIWRQLNGINYQLLKKKRAERGVLEFDLGETKMEVDKKGKPTDVLTRIDFLAHVSQYKY